MSKQVYISSPNGVVSTKGAIKNNLTTIEGNVRVWETEEKALQSIKIAKGTAESILDGHQMALKEVKEICRSERGRSWTEFDKLTIRSEFVEMYSDACKKMEKEIEFYNSCEIKELRYN